MKKSTTIGIGALALVGVGAYFYFKNKKEVVVNDVALVDATIAPIIDSTTSTTATTPPPIQTGVSAIIEPNIIAPIVLPATSSSFKVDTSYVLPLGVIRDNENQYLSEAKRISGNMKLVNNWLSTHSCSWVNNENLKKVSEQDVNVSCVKGATKVVTPSINELLEVMNKKVNSLGYKVSTKFAVQKI